MASRSLRGNYSFPILGSGYSSTTGGPVLGSGQLMSQQAMEPVRGTESGAYGDGSILAQEVLQPAFAARGADVAPPIRGGGK